jgi:hypothetical protein
VAATGATVLSIRNSSIFDCLSNRHGGGLYVGPGAAATATQSTFSGNLAAGDGGGIMVDDGRVTLVNATITGNSCEGGDGGGVRVAGTNGRCLPGNTVIAGNTDNSSSSFHPDVSGDFDSKGNNFTGVADGATGLDDGNNRDRSGDAGNPLDPVLSALVDDGGQDVPAHHRALIGSPLVNAGSDALLADAAWTGMDPTFDQRRAKRNFGGVDVGSTEFEPIEVSASYPDVSAAESPLGTRPARIVLVRDSADPLMHDELNVRLFAVSQPSPAFTNDYLLSVPGAGSAAGLFVTFPAGVFTVEVLLTPVDDNRVEGSEFVGLAVAEDDFHSPVSTDVTGITKIADNDFEVTVYSGSGAGSLPAAVAELNLLDGGSIVFDNRLASPVPQPRRVLLDAPLTVSTDIAIAGPPDNGAGVTLDARGLTHHFRVGGRLTLDSLTLTGGFERNGGSIAAFGSGELFVRRCTFHGNTAIFDGGAVHLDDSATMELTDSTVSGNTADGDGGGIAGFGGNLTLIHSTVAENLSDGDGNGAGAGGGIFLASGRLGMANTIVAKNKSGAGGPDLLSAGGSVSSLGFNLIGDNSDAAGPFPAGSPNGNNDYAGTGAAPLDPRIGQLRPNGGPTPTHALGVLSPALDAGKAGFPDPVDQRGLDRTDGKPDIGSYEHLLLDYDYWAGFTFPPAADASTRYAHDLDWDGDGSLNGFERLFGTDATDSGSRDQVRPVYKGNELVLTFPLAFTVDAAAEVDAEWTDRFDAPWNPNGLVFNQTASPGGPLDPVMEITVPRGPPGKFSQQFGRVIYRP